MFLVRLPSKDLWSGSSLIWTPSVPITVSVQPHVLQSHRGRMKQNGFYKTVEQFHIKAKKLRQYHRKICNTLHKYGSSSTVEIVLLCLVFKYLSCPIIDWNFIWLLFTILYLFEIYLCEFELNQLKEYETIYPNCIWCSPGKQTRRCEHGFTYRVIKYGLE